jgi:hypothetical protein
MLPLNKCLAEYNTIEKITVYQGGLEFSLTEGDLEPMLPSLPNLEILLPLLGVPTPGLAPL